MSAYVIRAEELGKCYHIERLKKSRMLREVLVDGLSRGVETLRSAARGRNPASAKNQEIWALKDVSFSINAGESVGIIGNNGAGKSTLLKILALITAPTTGRVRIRGRVGSLLEVGTGFHSELTGRENVYLNGAILGMKRREIDARFDEIVAFSEITEYLDTPVKHYSNGMRMRLAFSVAAHLDPEILLIDEVLAVGDVAFQRKSLNKMNSVVGAGRTVLFVSHNLAAVRALCQKAILIDNGQVQSMGPVEPVIQQYLDANQGRMGDASGYVERDGSGTRVLSAQVLDDAKNPSAYLPHDRPVFIRLLVQISELLSQTYINLKIFNQDMETVLESYDFEENDARLEVRKPGRSVYDVQIPAHILPPGKYYLGFEISRLKSKADKGRLNTYHQVNHVSPFEIYDNGSALSKANVSWKGLVHPVLRWEPQPEPAAREGQV